MDPKSPSNFGPRFGADLETILGHIGVDVGRFGGRFGEVSGSISGSMSGHFGVDFGTFWGRFRGRCWLRLSSFFQKSLKKPKEN